MAQIFPKWANEVPQRILLGLIIFATATVAGVWYYFSPEYTDVGYAPEQPIEYSHKLHAGQLDIDCQYCHTNVFDSKHANVPATQTCMNCHNQIDGSQKPEEIDSKGGIRGYGKVKSSFILVKGSIPGPKKRAIVMTPGKRATKKKKEGLRIEKVIIK